MIGGTAAVFVTDTARRTTALTFTAPGEGDLTYYVSGVKAGRWTLIVNGQAQGRLTAGEDDGFLTFTAPAGATITLNPN